MDEEQSDIATGQEVTVRGQRWTVLRSTAYEDCTALWLNGIDRGNAAVHRTVLLPFDSVERHHRDPPVRTAGSRRWCRFLRHHLWQQRPFGGLDALIPAGIQLHPYQLEPALAIHRHGRLRVLIADAVGLGKTIQAAAALAQLTRDDPGVRCLVVCPAGLRIQWRSELAERFGLEAVICDPDWLAAAARELPPGVNPWSLPDVFIASIDLIKRPEVLRDLEDLTWDLAVFDEAHGLAPGTARLAAARSVADRSRRILMLTATPPDGDPDHLGALMSLGRAPDGDDIVVFRRTRADVGLGGQRRTVTLAVRPSAAEAAMHQLLEAYTSAVWHAAAGRDDAAGRLLSILLRKRALSSAGSLAVSLARRLTLLASRTSAPKPSQILLPLDDDEVQDDAPTDAIVGARGLDDEENERIVLAAVHAAATAAAEAESKVDVLRRFVRRARQPLIVFTEYRDTLARLAAAVDTDTLQLHGGMLPQERAEIQSRFARDGGVLLATDAASEGLNLHQRCRVVVHFELPWNPMRLEQRIGRVDRLGQRRRVHEVLLVARHTAERLVLVPLVRRIRAAQAAGSGSLERLSESDVASGILGDMPFEPPTSPPPVTTSLSFGAESRVEARRLAAMRTAGCRGTPPSGPILVCPRDRSRALSVITRAVGETAGGRHLGSAVVPLRIELADHRHLESTDDARAFLRMHEALIARTVHDHLSGTSPWHGWPHVCAALIRREHEIRSLATATVISPVQAGLFDRHAEAEEEGRRQSMTARQVEAETRIVSLERERGIRVHVEVVAICTGRLDGR